MHTRSRPVLGAVGRCVQTRNAATAVKPALANKWARQPEVSQHPKFLQLEDAPNSRGRAAPLPSGSSQPVSFAPPKPSAGPITHKNKWSAPPPKTWDRGDMYPGISPGQTHVSWPQSRKTNDRLGAIGRGGDNTRDGHYKVAGVQRSSKNLDRQHSSQRDPLAHRTKPPFTSRVPVERFTSQNNHKDSRSHQIKTLNQGLIQRPKSLPTPLNVSIPSSSQHDKDNRKRDRLAYKQRGSLTNRISDDRKLQGHHHRPSQGLPAGVMSKQKRSLKSTEKKMKVDLFIPKVVSVGTLARLLKVPLGRLQSKMREAGMREEATYDYVLTADYAALLAEEFGRNAIFDDDAAFDIYPPPPTVDPSSLPARPPIVTIMGHVDHGKTTLLDTLRSSSVATGEAGGITQHIGAFSVPVPSNTESNNPQTITFLDTPGHAAFSAMRARGARVTDVVVLVVAADDGVMPQTKEVIDLVHNDQKIQLVVAINKVDKPGIDIDRVQSALMVENVQLEALGGDIPAVQVSGLTGKGLDELVETISAVSELQDLRAERDGPVHGYVLESKVQKGLGAVATVLVLRGCLQPGTNLICGKVSGKVRAMTDATGKATKSAYPGDAVIVSGWKELPSAGDEVLQGTEQDIKKALANRIRKAEQESMLVDVEAINAQRRQERELREAESLAAQTGSSIQTEKEEGPKELRLVIKGDVSGSVEALIEALQYIGNGHARVKIVDSGVGEVSESDVLRAKAAEGMVIAFSVPVPKATRATAGQNEVVIYDSSIIYQVIDEVRTRVTDLLPTEHGRKVTGEALVLQMFDIHLPGKRIKKVAGCRVTSGVVEKSRAVQVVRNGEVIYEGKLETFRHRKDDITEAGKNTECGIAVDGFDELKPDDMIQAYEQFAKPKYL